MRTSTRLTVERLEDRCNPSALSQPWPEPGHLTLSFAPDGTVLSGAPSNLFQTLNGAAPTTQWQQVILQVFQTWAVNANLNIGLVADGGQPFGTPGAVQGDERFGDIRVGMTALPANLVATTSPFSWTGSTWSGDVIFNSSYDFGLGGPGQYDLFTVALHEAGHALGIPSNATDVNSTMYGTYSGARTGPDSLDVANVQALYGARSPDAFDAATSNTTLATATALGNSQLGFNADLTTATDVDYYKVVTPANKGTATFQITAAGLSLLVPTVSVYNGGGHLMATQSAAGPFSNTVSVTISDADANSVYYFAVSHATSDAFGVGAYSARITFTTATATITGVVPSLVPTVMNTATHTNTSIATAAPMPAPMGPMSAQAFQYLEQANLVYGGDADYYQFQAPAAPSAAGTYALDAIVWQTDPNGLVPQLHLFDSDGNPVAIQVLANSSGVYSIQLNGVAAGNVYYLEVAAQTASGTGSTGGYVYGVKFNELPETAAPPLGSNTLPTASSTDAGTLAMNQNGVFYFELTAANGSASVSSILTMTVYDTNGNAVAVLSAQTGAAPSTAAVYLPAGTYTIDFSIGSSSDAYQPVTYWVSGKILSEPIGPYYSGSNPPPPGSSSSTDPSNSMETYTSTTTTFASDGASVSVNTADGTISVPIPQPGDTTKLSFTTAVGVTTVTLTTAADGTTTLTVTMPSANSLTDTMTTSGDTSTETLTTSDGIQVTIVNPVTNPAPTYSGPSSGPPPPPPYQY